LSLAEAQMGELWPQALAVKYTDSTGAAPVYARGAETLVTRGKCLRSDLPVAIKKISKQHIFDDGQLTRCRDEAEILRRVSHPNVVPLLDALETDAAFFLIMPLASEGSLFIRMRHKTVTEFEARNFASQALAGLRHVHALRWVHGDIKPHNFLLSEVDGRLVAQLCDFGMADPVGEDGTVKFTGLRGTSGYFAPEQLRGQNYGFGVDIFAFGVTLYALVCGYAPFDPPSNFEPLEFDPRDWKHVSREGTEFFERVLALQETQRLSAEVAALDAWFLAELSEEQPVEKFVPPPDTTVKFHSATSCPMLSLGPVDEESEMLSQANPNEPEDHDVEELAHKLKQARSCPQLEARRGSQSRLGARATSNSLGSQLSQLNFHPGEREIPVRR
jgi:serine/threonine protein kinase